MRKMKVRGHFSSVMEPLTSGSKDWRCNGTKIDGFCCLECTWIISPPQRLEGKRNKQTSLGGEKRGGSHTISLLIHEGWPGSACDKTQVINIL